MGLGSAIIFFRRNTPIGGALLKKGVKNGNTIH
jgi:hypothetical protein